jgi:hypothetical protein
MLTRGTAAVACQPATAPTPALGNGALDPTAAGGIGVTELWSAADEHAAIAIIPISLMTAHDRPTRTSADEAERILVRGA